MALDATNIIVGAGTFNIGAYVAAGGAGTLADVGHTSAANELAAEFENTDFESERAQGIVKTVPSKTGYTLKIPIMQAESEMLRIALAQPAANQTGTGENLTLRVGARVEQYHQATIVTTGVGTTGVRTLTFWKLQAIAVDAIQYGKNALQQFIVTFRVMFDDSVTTADKFWKSVDA